MNPSSHFHKSPFSSCKSIPSGKIVLAQMPWQTAGPMLLPRGKVAVQPRWAVPSGDVGCLLSDLHFCQETWEFCICMWRLALSVTLSFLQQSCRLIKALLGWKKHAGPSSFATSAKSLVARAPKCPPHRGSGALGTTLCREWVSLDNSDFN